MPTFSGLFFALFSLCTDPATRTALSRNIALHAYFMHAPQYPCFFSRQSFISRYWHAVIPIGFLPVQVFAALIVGGILCAGGLNPGFGYRIRQAVCKLRVCLCTGAFSRRLSRAVAPRWAKIGNITRGSALWHFAPPSSCGHWDIFYPAL